jgi:hypothetical protein
MARGVSPLRTLTDRRDAGLCGNAFAAARIRASMEFHCN